MIQNALEECCRSSLAWQSWERCGKNWFAALPDARKLEEGRHGNKGTQYTRVLAVPLQLAMYFMMSRMICAMGTTHGFEAEASNTSRRRLWCRPAAAARRDSW